MARNANGASGSLRFSARWKCTRPTVFHAGLNARSVSWTDAFDAASRAAKAPPIAVQRPRSTSGVRYSAPTIGGAAATMASRSASSGRWSGRGGRRREADALAASGCAQSAVTNRAEKSRQ